MGTGILQASTINRTNHWGIWFLDSVKSLLTHHGTKATIWTNHNYSLTSKQIQFTPALKITPLLPSPRTWRSLLTKLSGAIRRAYYASFNVILNDFTSYRPLFFALYFILKHESEWKKLFNILNRLYCSASCRWHVQLRINSQNMINPNSC